MLIRTGSVLQQHYYKLLSTDGKPVIVQHVVVSQSLHAKLVLHGKTEESTTELHLVSLDLNVITFDSQGKLKFSA